ncbi:MAG: ABC transporter substrate-binding protein, partial [Pseudomonadota bacterium]
MRHFNPSRRGFIAGAGALAGTTALMRPGMAPAAAHLASQELRTVGLSVTVQERILNDFKEKSGVGSVSGKADIFPNTQTELLSGSTAYDVWETIGERLPAMTITNTIKPIATSDLENWGNIRSIFTDADPRMEPRAQISGQI